MKKGYLLIVYYGKNIFITLVDNGTLDVQEEDGRKN
jgi:hypothetical protein